MSKKFLTIIFISILFVAYLQVNAFSFELEQNPNLELEGKNTQEKIAILKRDIASQDANKKEEAISSLGRLGGEAVPILLEQLAIELNKKEKVSLGGKVEERMSRFARYIILSLGHTLDRRSMQPLIDIALSDSLSVDLRLDAIGVLVILAGATPSSTFIPQAESGVGQEATSEDKANIQQTLVILSDSKEDALKDEAKIALEEIKSN